MRFRSLFDALFARPSLTSARQSRHAPPDRRRSRCFRPLLEILEDRTLLSTYTVNSLTDTGAGAGLTGDLRYCTTNATSGSDTINIGVAGTITLESALPTLSASVAIQGPGASQLTVERDPASPSYFDIFVVGSAATVQISGLTLANCYTAISNSGTATVTNAALSGNYYAIANSGSATITNTALSGNYITAIVNSGSATVSDSTLSDNFGSAIANTGNLTINNSTISGNSAIGSAGYVNNTPSGTLSYLAGDGVGGGIYMGGGTLSINSSTLADNQATGGSSGSSGLAAGNGYGGGVYIAGGTVSINNSTLAGNRASGGASNHYPGSGNGSGGGIYNAAGPSALQMHDTIVADNTADAGPDLDGGFTSLGHNLIGSSALGSGFAASDLLNVDLMLGPLQNNGGPTQTMALLTGSPAINTGDNTGTPAYDQRGPGFPRIVSDTIDIGAFEVQGGGFAVSLFPSTTTAGAAHTFTVTALNADGTTDTGYTGTVHFTSSDPHAVLPGDAIVSNGTGQFSATLNTAGSQLITVTDATAGRTGTEADILVQPAAASTLIVAGFPSPATSGIAGSFTVTAEDRYGNQATGYGGTVHFTSSDPQAVLPANATLSNGTGQFNATLNTAGTQSITATDTVTSTVTGSQTGIHVVPLPTITGPSFGAADQTLTFTLGDGGGPAGTVFTVRWGDGSTIQTSSTTVSHSYSYAGTAETISVTATDPTGFSSIPVNHTVNILSVYVIAEADPAATGKELLVIDGRTTSNNESIVLAGDSGNVSLTFGGAALGDVVPAGSNPVALVIVFGGYGNDIVDARNLSVSSVLEGGPGGNDTLYGGPGRNLLIGGAGADTLRAGSAGDILIGGTTQYDTNFTALAFLMAEWDRTDVSYATRVKQLDGSQSGGLNGSYFLKSTTVLDDNATDVLYGGAGLDWFFAHKKGRNADQVMNQTKGEVVTTI